MTAAFLFPGQGVTNETASRAWYDRSSLVRALVDHAATAAGTTPDRLLDVRPGALPPTEHLEPLHTALCLGILEELARRGARPDIVAGHSLGEIPACAAAGACAPEDAVALAAERGRLMAREAKRRPGGMLTLRSVPRETVDAALAFASDHGAIAVAAHNAPDQWVVSGEWG
ncbi:MAG TPA: acyltransferase domain-containing protein, partial [Acidobacteriota bacterium]|nr:acyltransferase domain-containing protein [Acidobacteriota bacterium]